MGGGGGAWTPAYGPFLVVMPKWHPGTLCICCCLQVQGALFLVDYYLLFIIYSGARCTVSGGSGWQRERLSKSNATGDRLSETQAINKSLSALGDVFQVSQK